MMAETKRKADLKVIILGDYNVGKTSFICRYIDGTFQTKEPTIGAAFFLKQWGPYNVAVWDTAGDERYTGLSNFYCRNAGAAILAFDMTSVSSFESLWARFIPLLDSALENCIKVVVGMKMDLLDNGMSREITVEEATRFSREINSHIDISKLPKDPYFETSSLKGSYVTEVFEYIFNHCLPLTEAQKKQADSTGIVDLSKSPATTKSGKKCC
ncbi:ras-related protein Rab-20-like [Ylistrum balloti]|uniref:ras-related protein Rab-20-like n=1 Tax=Ylistrum balloti TaxID=509963 RepID=UPI002905D8E8|nr:ras-related protein Rab-20-like [Ylistrum balloti]